MTISPYQVNSVLNAYTRQSKLKVAPASTAMDGVYSRYRDVVSLSTKEAESAEELEKISYNLCDVIMKNEKA